MSSTSSTTTAAPAIAPGESAPGVERRRGRPRLWWSATILYGGDLPPHRAVRWAGSQAEAVALAERQAYRPRDQYWILLQCRDADDERDAVAIAAGHKPGLVGDGRRSGRRMAAGRAEMVDTTLATEGGGDECRHYERSCNWTRSN